METTRMKIRWLTADGLSMDDTWPLPLPPRLYRILYRRTTGWFVASVPIVATPMTDVRQYELYDFENNTAIYREIR